MANEMTMTTITGEHFFKMRDDNHPGRVIEQMRFENCHFDSCVMSLWGNRDQPITVRNVELANVKVRNCHIGPAIMEDMLVDQMKTDDLFILWGTLFRHVVFRGDCGAIKLNSTISWESEAAHAQREFDDRRLAFYRETDWSLDITAARFRIFETSGIPSRLIRRDPRTQVVVKRERLGSVPWRRILASQSGYWSGILSVIATDVDEDCVLVAP
ncbi:MAG: hypothetical protein NT069_15950, partial [Planctomycetota bacterium]|nr:hypothetical protein [Planctomycetota bacterium]